MIENESPRTRRLQGSVLRAGLAHVIVGLLFVQFADVFFPYLGIVDETQRWALLVSVATFPITLFIAWLMGAPWSAGGRAIAELVALIGIAVMAGLWVSDNLPERARHYLEGRR